MSSMYGFSLKNLIKKFRFESPLPLRHRLCVTGSSIREKELSLLEELADLLIESLICDWSSFSREKSLLAQVRNSWRFHFVTTF